MTAYVTLSCGGDWNGFPCRGARSTKADDGRYPVTAARLAASDAGWTETVDGQDLCPACTRAAAERTVERLAAEAPALTRDEAVASALPALPPEWHADVVALAQTSGRQLRIEMTEDGLILRTDGVLEHMAAMRDEYAARLTFQPPGRSALRLAVDVLTRLTRSTR